MKVLYIQPFSHPVVLEIDNDLEVIQSLLNCDYFECVYLDEDVELLCDEMGLYHPYQFPNRRIHGHFIVGPCILVGNDGIEDFDSLSEASIQKYKELLYDTEIEIGLGNRICIKDN